MRLPLMARREEEEALLPGPSPGKIRRDSQPTFFPKFNSWRAHPFWLIPVVLIASMSRGITMSPRIQVYKAIACRTLNQEDEPGLLDLAAIDCSGSAVQARAATIQASVVTIMSVLSAISAGFWSRLGDFYGRKPIISVYLIGAIAMEFCFVLVMNSNSLFGRHAKQLILVGPIIEGLAGGLSAFNGVVHAYTSDCTRHGSRSKIFSTIQGIVFVGLSLGPWLSGAVLPSSDKVDEFFYASMFILAITLLYVAFICPESLRLSVQQHNSPADDRTQFKTSAYMVVRRYIQKFIAALIIPIAMFAPRPIPGNSSRKNYNLTLLGMGLFLYLVSTGVYQSKYLYAEHMYSWTTAQLGHYMSLLWFSRALNLLIFLPIIISYLKPKIPPSDGVFVSPEGIAAELRFDKYLAQFSLAVDGIADFLVAITPTSSQVTFVGLSCLSSLTSGGNPALHSLGAVCLHACGYGSEVGALFGGLAVLSAIAHIISPYVYALTYGSTVAYFPKAIFCLAAALLTSVVLLLSGIRASPGDIVVINSPRADGEQDEDASQTSSQTQAEMSRSTLL